MPQNGTGNQKVEFKKLKIKKITNVHNHWIKNKKKDSVSKNGTAN